MTTTTTTRRDRAARSHGRFAEIAHPSASRPISESELAWEIVTTGRGVRDPTRNFARVSISLLARPAARREATVSASSAGSLTRVRPRSLSARESASICGQACVECDRGGHVRAIS